jgi:hypothetical protein
MKFRHSLIALVAQSWLTVSAANAAEPAAVNTADTGIMNIGLGVFLISIAAALLLTLLFRSSATRLAQKVTTSFGKRQIRKVLAAKSRDVLEDFILPGAYGGLTHIDYAVLTSGGILCIQAKHYNGVVFGDAEEPQWTNVDGLTSRRFLNPLIQNEGRSRALSKVVPDVPIANLVVFTGSVQFSAQPAANVIHARDLQNFIAKFVFGPCKIDDGDAIWLTVKAAALTDEDTRKDFRAQLSFS